MFVWRGFVLCIYCNRACLFVVAGVRTVDVQAVEGMVAQFPCDLGTAANDKVYMVFWFRDDAGIPLYRFVIITSLDNAGQSHGPMSNAKQR
ncbi:Endonuclease-reverse transcriptase [Operophtera brumata]|uniref:Endonuclease-reverse transcriptase n=1 Tax=Operophtera brumata TaxID=104452 RepID=A0A0L7KKW3_OPEBR|nr:Endonuclease-reverse transcriptase [Operophtera brumata]